MLSLNKLLLWSSTTLGNLINLGIRREDENAFSDGDSREWLLTVPFDFGTKFDWWFANTVDPTVLTGESIFVGVIWLDEPFECVSLLAKMFGSLDNTA